jgi:hypothetical protein
MEGGDDTEPAVGYQDGNAIGGLHGKQEAGSVGDEAVAFAWAGAGWVRIAGRTHDTGMDNTGMDNTGMHLAQGDEGCLRAASDCFGEKAAILRDDGAVVCGGEAEVEFAGSVVRAISAAESATAGAESVPEPAILRPTRDAEPLDAIGSNYGRGSGTGEL